MKELLKPIVAVLAFCVSVLTLPAKPPARTELFQMRAGDIHPSRIPKEYWQHRIRMAKAMGLNTIGLAPLFGRPQ
jgi:hypothetical protein